MGWVVGSVLIGRFFLEEIFVFIAFSFVSWDSLDFGFFGVFGIFVFIVLLEF